MLVGLTVTFVTIALGAVQAIAKSEPGSLLPRQSNSPPLVISNVPPECDSQCNDGAAGGFTKCALNFVSASCFCTDDLHKLVADCLQCEAGVNSSDTDDLQKQLSGYEDYCNASGGGHLDPIKLDGSKGSTTSGGNQGPTASGSGQGATGTSTGSKPAESGGNSSSKDGEPTNGGPGPLAFSFVMGFAAVGATVAALA